jgi:hypothetical protein
MTTATLRSPKEIEDLKRQWRSDPIWDIEDSEGFEAHREELAAYRAQCEAEWSQAVKERLEAKAVQLGCPGNTSLAAYVEDLEGRLKSLEDRFAALPA